MSKKGVYSVVILLAITLTTVAVFAKDPEGPNQLDVESSERRTVSTDGVSIDGEAGNVSELYFNHTTVTQGWQGYYGNVSGRIVLDDANNDSMYEWSWTDPYGEIFATRDSDGVTWTSGLVCANITHIESEESTLNFNSGTGQDIDGINETFTETTHPAFNVSTTGFAQDACNFTVSTYVNDASGSRTFNETLLYSKSDSSLIYAAFIVPGGADGFKTGSTKYDFQMLVAEDGHGGDVSPTDYYFYIELG